MDYYLDTEFLEGTQKRGILSRLTKNRPTIDLISIGIVAEDGREYYAISKDFNLKEAWNRYDNAPKTQFEKQNGFEGKRIYWIRENVLRPIFNELHYKSIHDKKFIRQHYYTVGRSFSYDTLKSLIKYYSKSNSQIAEEIFQFCAKETLSLAKYRYYNCSCENIQFYGYYADYDWVALAWLFGKMNDLPKGFPMYCRDLKQILDERIERTCEASKETFEVALSRWKNKKNYPKQENEHNALSDARWNKKLHEFLKVL